PPAAVAAVGVVGRRGAVRRPAGRPARVGGRRGGRRRVVAHRGHAGVGDAHRGVGGGRLFTVAVRVRLRALIGGGAAARARPAATTMGTATFVHAGVVENVVSPAAR